MLAPVAWQERMMPREEWNLNQACRQAELPRQGRDAPQLHSRQIDRCA